MKLLADKKAPLDKELQEKCVAKIQNGNVNSEDLKDLFASFVQFCNNTEELQYEMSGMNQTFQFNLDDQTYTIAFKEGNCEAYEGASEKPTVIFFIAIDDAIEIIKGNIHSSVAQMNGDIIYTGPRPEAIAFQRIFELVLDEII